MVINDRVGPASKRVRIVVIPDEKQNDLLMDTLLTDEDSLKDVVFLLGKEQEEVKAHRCVLASRSDYFKALFRHTADTRIAIPETNVSAFRVLMRYLYTTVIDIHIVDDNTKCDLSVMADKYQLPRLVDICIDSIELTLDNCVDWFEKIGYLDHNLVIVDFISTNMYEVWRQKSTQLLRSDSLRPLLDHVFTRSGKIGAA